MEKVTVDDLDRHLSTASSKRPVGDALGIEGFALHHYELDPGETFSTNLHAHLDQEEIFYILDGTATFETDDGSIEVSSGEAIRFPPGKYQHGRNDTDSRVTGLAMGAPKESESGRIECPKCSAREAPVVEWTADRSAIVYECPACGAEINRQN